MIYLGIQYSIGQHGGGVHQWNTFYQDVQYNYQVSAIGAQLGACQTGPDKAMRSA